MARKQTIQGQILIKTPITSNGRDTVLGPDGRRVFKETIAEAAARPLFEKINDTRPTPLKHIIEDIAPAKSEPVKETVKNVTSKKNAETE
jgi:hypothetical protein